MADAPTALAETLDALASLATVHDRPDLQDAALRAIQLLRSRALRVVVVGDYKRGKSSLINALVDAPVCAVDDDIATAARLEIGYAEQPTARQWRHGEPGGTMEVFDIDVVEAATASTDSRSTLVRAGLPRPLLGQGLVLVDTPGIGGIASAPAMATASTLAEAFAVLFVTDVSQEMTRAEMDALRDAQQRCDRVTVVATKIDMYPHWRTILDEDRRHLAEHGLDCRIVAVSNTVRFRALAAEDRALNAESGFPDLLAMIADELLPGASEIAAAGALATALRVYRQLHEPLVVELLSLEAALDGSGAAHALVDAARAELASFRERAAGWQQLLSDGVTDLAAAVDLDLRTRIKAIVQEADAELDNADPEDIWDEFEPALYRSTAEAIDANLTLLREGASDLARRLAELIQDEYEGLGELTVRASDEQTLGTAQRTPADSGSSATRAQQAFRAGYGGAMPIMALGGMALGILGLGTLVMPLAAVAGITAGRRALTDERERRLGQRRQQARIAVKKYIEDAQYRASNDSKAGQRHVHRSLRDYFGARTQELATTFARNIQQAEAAASADREAARRRMAEVRAELERLELVAGGLAAGR